MEIGVDIERIERFKKHDLEKDSNFLKSVFSDKELEYCFSHKNPAKHLAARFCGKEAFVKATSDLDISIDFDKIEILNKENGKPYFNLPKNDILNKYEFKISMSHEKTYALASVVMFEKDDNITKTCV